MGYSYVGYGYLRRSEESRGKAGEGSYGPSGLRAFGPSGLRAFGRCSNL